jgi:uncharacterized phage protein gp47/JayE
MALDGYGLVPTGLRVPSRTVIREDLNADIRSQIGASMDLSDDDPFGQFVGLMSDRLLLLWLLLLVLYKSADRDQAGGATLEAICMLTGTLRDEPLPSTADVVLTGVPTTVVPGTTSFVKTTSTGVRFALDADATIAAVPAWALNTAYAVGQRRTSGGAVFQVKTAGTSANGGDGPGFGLGGGTAIAGQPLNITDGTVVWWWLGIGTGAVDAAVTCESKGPTVAVAMDLGRIDTPVSGWQGVVNLTDATLGREVATDAELRIDADEDVFRPGSGGPDAVRQELRRLPGVETASVYFNPDSSPNGIGVPAHTVECLVAGGDDAQIAAVIFRGVYGGIGTFGNTTVSVKDSEGTAHDVMFSRPVDVDIHVEVDLEKVAAADATAEVPAYPSDGDDQVAAAIVARGNALLHGWNVYGGKISAPVERIAGVLGVTEVRLGLAPGPATTTPIVIGVRERARFALTRVSVFSSDGDV